jgi:hypothetical protein
VDHGRDLAGEGGEHGRQRGIAAEADHDRGLQPAEGGVGLQHALADGQAGADHADRIAAPEGRGRQADPLLGGEALGEAGAAAVGGQDDAPAAGDQDLGEGLGGEQVAARPAGGDDGEPAAHQANWPAGATRGGLE